MKKITLLSLLVLFSFCSFAQRTSVPLADRIDNQKNIKAKPAKYTENILLDEGFDTWPPTDWIIINGAQSSGIENWHSLAGGAGVEWDQTLRNPQDEWLITPSFTLQNNASYDLYFWFAAKYEWNVTNDYADIMVKVSADNGATWSTPIWQEDEETLLAQSGVPFPWTTNVWYEASISMDAYAGQTIKIAFHYLGQDGDDFAVDDVQLSEIIYSNDATLSDLKVDGTTVAGFDPAVYSYDITLPYGTTTIPTVIPVTNDPNAFAMPFETDTLPGTTTINVFAEDNTSLKYYVNFLMPGDVATLSDLTVDGTTIAGFDSSIVSYNVELANGTVIVPTIGATLSDVNAAQVITQASSIPGAATVNVTAQDGITTELYTVNFYEAPVTGKDALLMNLLVDGVAVEGFTPLTNDYTVNLAPGTTVVPTITYILNDGTATTVQTDATVLPGQTTVEVTSQDATVINTYTVTFHVISTDAALSGLTVDGTSLATFSPTTYDYSVEVPYGTTVVPTIGATINDANAVTTITQATDLSETSEIVVTAEDGVTKNTYSVSFTIAPPSSDASLADIMADGLSISTFSPTTYIYNLGLTAGTTVAPTITATESDVTATVNITQDVSVPGQATIEVTAQDGTTIKTYTVYFTIAADPGKDVSLLDLLVDGATVTNFVPNTTEYTVNLAPGTTVVPTVAYTLNDVNATAVQTNATALPGQTTIVVTSQDATVTETYTVNFHVISDDATLSYLALDGVTISGFTATTTNYTVLIPKGTVVMPNITYGVNDENATAVFVDATVLPTIGNNVISTVTVTAEDGVTKKVYKITFKLEASSDATLSDLLVNGVSISGFSPSVYNYTGKFTMGALIPTISAVANNAGATLNIVQADIYDLVATVTVTAEDGTELIYTVTFTLLSNNAKLSDLTVDAVTVTGFSANKYDYEVEVAEGNPAPVVAATVFDTKASAAITQATAVPGAATVVVTAEDGSKKTYTVSFIIEGTSAIAGVDVNASLTIYPNPNNGIVNVAFASEQNQELTLRLYNTAGQKLIAKTYDAQGQFNEQLDLQALPKGVYIIKLSTDAGNAIQRVVIQ